MIENNKIKNLIIDMDGVLWEGDTPMPGLVEFFDTIHQRKIGFVLATNNAMKTAKQYVDKLANFGVRIPTSQVLTSSEATACYLRQCYPMSKSAYIVGEIGLLDAMRAQGFDLLETEGFVGAEARTDFVVAGMTQKACYEHLANAAFLINQGAIFVGTNPDVTFPTEAGPLPGVGSWLAFLEAATNVAPIIIGKPNKAMFEEALLRLNSTAEETVMIGDRLNTDIAGGHKAGLRTMLILTGITKETELNGAVVQPDWIFTDLFQLATYLKGNS